MTNGTHPADARATRRRRAVLRAVGAVALATTTLVASACQPTNPTPQPFDGWVAPGYTRAIITHDGTVDYRVAVDGTGIRVAAPPGTGPNIRQAVVADTAPVSVDQEACVSWYGPVVSNVQPGVVLRVRSERGRTRLIMVTNNVWAGLRVGVNVHVVDTDEAPALRQVGSLVTDALGDPGSVDRPWPWRFCARAIGATVQYKAWSQRLPEPAWDDPHHAATHPLPTDFVYAGKPGTYIGHLASGQSARLLDQRSTVLTGGPGDAFWTRSREWAVRAEQLVRERPTAPLSAVTAPQIVEYARRATIGDATGAARTVAGTASGRIGEAQRVYAELLGVREGNLRGRTTIDFALAVIAKPEFQGGITDAEFVDRLYQRLLRRPPTVDNTRTWVTEIARSGRAAVARRILTSPSRQVVLATEAATEAWGRAPTPAEVTSLTAVVRAQGFDGGYLRAQLIAPLAPHF